MSEQTAGYDVQRSTGALVGRGIRLKAIYSPTLVLQRLSELWARKTLSTQFLVVAVVGTCITILIAGTWIERRLRANALDAAALTSSHLMRSVIEDQVQELATKRVISQSNQQVILNLLGDDAHVRKILKVKIWLPDGTVAYSSDGLSIGVQLPKSAGLEAAMTGVVSAEFSAPRGFEVFENRTHLVPVFEIYSPLYAAGTTRIIAVSEFYEDATSLAAEVRKGSLQAQTFVGVLMVGMLSFLFLIVQRGSELIVEQKTRLERKLEEQNSLLDLQDQLNLRIAKLHRECSDLSDRLLERIGADLHDGPAQLLGLALLRLHEVQPSKANVTQASDDALATVQSAMREALTEIRNISAGISLPELESLELNEILQLVVANHERRTKTHVARKFEPLPLGTSVALKTCLYRCGQEALNNAFLHALGKGQFLSATSDVDSITLTISDAGPGIEHARPIKTGDKLGLVGLRHRVELLGGTFQIASSPTTGTTVSVRLPLE